MLQRRPDKGPKIKVANKVGTSLKSNVKYGGKNGNGNFKMLI